MTSLKTEPTDEEFDALVRKFPRAYRAKTIRAVERLEAALLVTGAPSGVTWSEALRRYRISKALPGARGMAAKGLLHQLVMDHAKKLDDVFQLVREFKPEDFITEGVISEVARRAAKGKRPNARTRAEKLEEIGVWLKRKEYDQSLNKAGLIDQATIIFKCGETDVKVAAHKAGLTRKYRQSSK